MSPRAFRTPTDRVDCDALLRSLSPAAEFKQAPWDWSILAYQKARRSQGPDLHSLRETYYDLLDKLLDVAPGGFPPLVSLRQVWMGLHREHGIQPKPDIQSLHTWANESADRCRLMMRHLVEIKRSGSSWMKVGLGPLLAKIQLPERDDTCDRPPTKARKLTKTVSAASSNSVVVCATNCQCPQCRKAEDIADSDDSLDSVSAEARGSMDLAPARPGAVARMLAKPRVEPRVGAPFKVVLRHKPETRKGGYILMHGKHLHALTCNDNPDARDVLKTMASHLNDECADISREEAKSILQNWDVE